ncbi:hypothetical protein LguiB_035322 [Lonicera macranthoides]
MIDGIGRGTTRVFIMLKVLIIIFVPSINRLLPPTVIDWHGMWELNIPPKMKKFMWRAIDDCLPTRVNLVARGVNVVSTCALCGQYPETATHVLLKCPVIQRVWRGVSVGVPVIFVNSIPQWWNDIVRRFTFQNIAVAAAVLWSLWESRNAAVFGPRSYSAAFTINKANLALGEWLSVAQCPSAAAPVSANVQQSSVYWQKPPLGVVKCNVDATIFEANKSIGFGGVLRDSAGGFLAAIQGTLQGSYSPLLAEAVGMRKVLSWLKDFSSSPVIVETDSQVLAYGVIVLNLCYLA